MRSLAKEQRSKLFCFRLLDQAKRLVKDQVKFNSYRFVLLPGR